MHSRNVSVTNEILSGLIGPRSTRLLLGGAGHLIPHLEFMHFPRSGTLFLAVVDCRDLHDVTFEETRAIELPVLLHDISESSRCVLYFSAYGKVGTLQGYLVTWKHLRTFPTYLAHSLASL